LSPTTPSGLERTRCEVAHIGPKKSRAKCPPERDPGEYAERRDGADWFRGIGALEVNLAAALGAGREGADPARYLQAITIAKAPSEKTLDELAQDMHTRADGLTHLMAKAEMELRRTSAQLRAVRYMRAVSVAAAVSAASAAIAAGAAAYVAFLGR
jgi:hypothetical protein